MSFWRKGKSLIIQDTVENGSNGTGDAGETQQENEGASHWLHQLTLEEDVAGGLGRHLRSDLDHIPNVRSSTHIPAAVGKIIGSALVA